MHKFPISNTRNKFIAVGCDTFAVIGGSVGRNYTTGCLSLCDSINNVINGSCSGIGCCQISIPNGVRNFQFRVKSFENHTRVWDFNPCSYAFVAEETTYNFSSTDLADLQGRRRVPVVFDWAVGDQTCDDHAAGKNLTSFAFKDNSDCEDFDNGPGYRCKCSKGYEGNPYIPNGCQDIDECAISSPCNMTCLNLPGTYNCSCAVGYEGDGKKNGSGCSRIAVPNKLPLIIYISLGISIGISLLLIGGSSLYWGSKQRKIANLREKLFQQNGGIMLQELSNHEGLVQSAKIFTEEDLKKATNNFNENNVLGKGGQGIVYKGVLPDNTINRLRIAAETSTALSYLHSAASTPIIHRDVKTANILLDDNYVAKVLDFGSSRLIAIDETQLSTLVQGTRGYSDPEYLQTGQLTEKSDVCSFGVVLVELLTGKKVISFSRPEAERNLSMYFILAMKEDRLLEIVDEQMMNDARVDKLKQVAILAKRCLEVKDDERPSMKEVAMELEGLRMTEKHPWVNDVTDSEETQHLLGDQLLDAYGGETSMSNSIVYDRMTNHDISPFNGGR
ncbi:hypothetical protein TEA_003246 [Camellia sinensis var. sinensis]|uniref:Protein kinase domain-containing protein n=1 Tax=Camellia sinensis var. sinensis TaxID=542762 RepID=A0A4S4E3K2_CAMSN|nr:hypothetical protein TEA_003246 [Camellia sinensis var. sinensis]